MKHTPYANANANRKCFSQQRGDDGGGSGGESV